jgi:hypothetical protein
MSKRTNENKRINGDINTDEMTVTACRCGALVGQKHRKGCTIERCPHCGFQALLCGGFKLNDRRRQPFDGRYPGVVDCERLGFFVGGDPNKPDLNTLVVKCRWNAEAQRWELMQ